MANVPSPFLLPRVDSALSIVVKIAIIRHSEYTTRRTSERDAIASRGISIDGELGSARHASSIIPAIISEDNAEDANICFVLIPL
ncbi:MAG: hypothetical protein IJX05_00310 [Clostridia bacterium]|nr:hypothetical protein [Clostridia bacterium]